MFSRRKETSTSVWFAACSDDSPEARHHPAWRGAAFDRGQTAGMIARQIYVATQRRVAGGSRERLSARIARARLERSNHKKRR